MALLFQVDEQVPPEQTPELILRCGGREVRSLGTCPLALCTMALDAQVGQEGVGEADQMQVCNCRPVRAILVLAKPQQLLGVFQPLFNGPAFFIRPDDVWSGERRGVGHQPENRFGGPFAREDHVQGAKGADLKPAGIHEAIVDLTVGLREGEGVGAAPPKQIPAIAAGFEFPALLEETAIALERGRKVEALLPAGLHDSRAEVVGIKQHHDLDASGSFELPNQLGGQFSGLAEGQPQGWTVRLFDVKSDAKRDDVITADHDGADILVAPDVRVGRGVLQLGDGGHGSPAFGVLGIIKDQVDGLPLAGMEGAHQGLGLLAERHLGVPPLNQEEVIEAGPVGRSVQIPIQVGDIPPSPHTGDGEDQQAKVGEMIPVKMPLQGVKKVVKAGGHAYDAEHGAILLTPPACGRWVRALILPGGLPLLPLLSSPLRQVPLKNQST
jgi:hypothetical protein